VTASRARSDGAAVRSAVQRLQALDNVTHVSVGDKVTKGKRTGARALKVHVTAKRDVSGSGRIPKTITARDARGRVHRFVTDVVEMGGTPELFGIRSGNRILAFDGDLGLAGLVFTKGDQPYVLTNAHVVCDVANQGNSGIAGWYDPPNLTRALGPIAIWTPLTADRPIRADAAAIEVGNRAIVDPLMVLGSEIPISRMTRMRAYSSSIYLPAEGSFLECVEPEPVLGDVEVQVDGVVLVYRQFWQVRNVDRLARRGLSGGVLLRRAGSSFEACGLVFGGVPDDYIWAFSFRPVFERIYNALP
jgi:hypothetical protein